MLCMAIWKSHAEHHSMQKGALFREIRVYVHASRINTVSFQLDRDLLKATGETKTNLTEERGGGSQ